VNTESDEICKLSRRAASEIISHLKNAITERAFQTGCVAYTSGETFHVRGEVLHSEIILPVGGRDKNADLKEILDLWDSMFAIW